MQEAIKAQEAELADVHDMLQAATKQQDSCLASVERAGAVVQALSEQCQTVKGAGFAHCLCCGHFT
jgi:hypothetical protein